MALAQPPSDARFVPPAAGWQTLRDLDFKKAISFIVPCWRRNDLERSKQAVLMTLYYALSVVRGVNKELRRQEVDQHAGELVLNDLRVHSRRAQLLASCLLQSISSKQAAEALNDAWRGVPPLPWCRRHMFRDAVRHECVHLLASSSMQHFLRR
eukprot:4366576-Prymnesium_polylepis.1